MFARWSTVFEKEFATKRRKHWNHNILRRFWNKITYCELRFIGKFVWVAFCLAEAVKLRKNIILKHFTERNTLQFALLELVLCLNSQWRRKNINFQILYRPFCQCHNVLFEVNVTYKKSNHFQDPVWLTFTFRWTIFSICFANELILNKFSM